MLRLILKFLLILVVALSPGMTVAQDTTTDFYNCSVNELQLGTSFPNAKRYYRAARCSHLPNNGFGTPWIANHSKSFLTFSDAPKETKYETIWLPRNAAHAQLDAIDEAVRKLDLGSIKQGEFETQIAAALNSLRRLMIEAPSIDKGLSDTNVQTIEVSADLDLLRLPYKSVDLLVIGLKGGAELSYLSLAKTRVSSTRYAVVTSLIIAGFGIWFLASGILGYRIRLWSQGKRKKAHWFAGANGRLSLANTQIALFSIVVFCLLLLQLLRTGVLADLSTDVLILIGIVSSGSALAKVSDTAKSRLSWENWLWLKQNGWFKEDVDYGPGQLVRDVHGGFDIPRLQAAAFSMLVAGYLVFEGFDGLSEIVIEPGILGVLGLSQFTYIGSKAVSPPSWSEYDTHITQFRDANLRPGNKDYAPRLKKLRDGFEAIFGYRPVNEIAKDRTALKFLFDHNTRSLFPLRISLNGTELATLDKPLDVYESRDIEIPDGPSQFLLAETGGNGSTASYPEPSIKFPERATQQFTVTSGDFK